MIRVVTIYIDLDNFGEIVKGKGLSEYKPNIVTGEITNLILKFAHEHNATILFGLDESRGTEEAVLEIIEEENIDKIIRDLHKLKRTIEKIGINTRTYVTASIGVGIGVIPSKLTAKIRSRKDIANTLTRYLAKKALEKAKKEGKNRIVVLS